MQRLIEHILKLKHWHSELDRFRNGWMREVTNFRNKIQRILKKNPSLKNYLADEYSEIGVAECVMIRHYFIYLSAKNNLIKAKS